jgi:hypothetical protein
MWRKRGRGPLLRGYIVHTIKNKLENYEERGDGGQL